MKLKNIVIGIIIWIAPLVIAKWAGITLDFEAGFWFCAWTVVYLWWIFVWIPKEKKKWEDERKKDKMKGWNN